MVSSIGSGWPGPEYNRNSASSNAAASNARAGLSYDEITGQVRAAVAGGSSRAQLEALIARLGPPVYSEAELAANEEEINGREEIKARLRAGIDDPAEELKAKAALVYPWSWPEERKLEAAREREETGLLDELVREVLGSPRPPTKRELSASAATQASNPIGIPVEDIQVWRPDPEIWKPAPDGRGFVFALSREELIERGVVVELTPEMKTELAAFKENERQREAEREAHRAANPDLYSGNGESNQMILTNVASLAPDAIAFQIQFVTYLIQNREPDSYDFFSANGEQKTQSIHQYLYWLQQRAQELESDGAYSPEMFR